MARKIVIGLVAIAWAMSICIGRGGASHYLYLSDQRIITLEVMDTSSLIVNYINLGNSFELLEARQLVLRDVQGRSHRGHLFLVDETEGAENPYAATRLIKPGEFLGFVLVGSFETADPLESVYLKVSGRILEFEQTGPSDFDLAAARIGQINLANRDRTAAIERAGFRRGYGKLLFSGSAEAAALDGLFTDEEVVPPIPLQSPRPRLPSSESGLPDPVVVRIGARVGRSGGLRDIRVLEGLSDKLNQIALETVRNSWKFLPAISGKEVAEADLKLNVVFNR